MKEFGEFKTVIVGGGFAGFTAAREPQDANQSFVVLEANNRVGGRSWTVLKDDYWIDNGTLSRLI